MHLPPHSFFAIRDGEPVTYRWQPPEVEDDATTEDLAKIHRSFWTWIEAQRGPNGVELSSRPEISDLGVSHLLRLAFLASLSTDEQRATVGNLYVPSPNEVNSIRILEFEPEEPLESHKSIARLCPTLVSPDAALIVAEDEGRLVARSIDYLDDRNASYEPLKHPQDWTGRRGGILVTIVCPGEIRLRQGRCDYTLRRNEVIGRNPVESTEPVATWLRELQRKMIERLPEGVRSHRFIFLEESEPTGFAMVLSRMLEIASRLRHGGALVVLTEPKLAPLSLKFRAAESRFHEQLDRVYCDWAEALDREDSAGGKRAMGRFEKRRHSLLTHASALGGLTATDGCVVLGRNLRLHGFGGIIDAEQARTQGILTFEGTEAEPLLSEEALLRRFGTRHRSAFYLCKACPKTLVFVVSQDGDIRLFASDDSTVRFFDNLSP